MRKSLLFATAFACLFAAFASAQEGNPVHKRPISGNAANFGGGGTANSSGTSGTGANIDVIYHRIFWRVNPDSSVKYIKGWVMFKFKTIQSNVSSITFDLNATHSIDSIRYNNIKVAVGNISRSGNIVTLNLGTTLGNNVIDSFTVYYGGTPPAVDNPPGAVGYQLGTDGAGTAGKYIYTLSESYEDRDWWPCKADMQDKIDSMDITISVPWATPTTADTFWAACNGRLIDSTISGNSRYFTFKSRYPIASYLVAIGVGKYNRYYRSVNVNGTTVPVVYNLLRGKSSYTTMLSKLDSQSIAVQAFSNKLGDYPFKLEKHGFYEFGFGGGMEHQTFSGIDNASLTNAPLLAHELMHQWFGDNVSFSNWNDLWLAEGFAAYGEGLYYELAANHPVSAFYQWKARRTTAMTRTVSAWIPNATASTSGLWNSAYGNTVYDRGCMVVSMLRAISGSTKFFQILTNYQTNRGKSSATTDTLKNYFNAGLGVGLDSFFRAYVGGSGPGTAAIGGIGNPINPVTWNVTGNRLVLQMGTQTKTSGSNVTYFRGPVVVHFTNAASGWTKDTTITFFDWGGGNLSYAGDGVSDTIPGNTLYYDLSFTPTNAFYDDSLRTLSTGSVTKNTSFTGYTWTGATNSSWTNAGNWAGGVVPPSQAEVVIATTGSNPVLTSNVSVSGLFMNAGTKISLGTGTLTINGPITGSATIIGSLTGNIVINGMSGSHSFANMNVGTLNFDQTSASTRSVNSFTVNTGASLKLGTAMEVYGDITLNSASMDFNGQNVILKSTATGTARIADLTGSSITNATNVTIERYIPANASRAWRLLSVPTTGQTIKQAWQENQVAGATTPAGYGMQITSNSASWAANGFDFQTVGNSLKTYDAATDTWVGVSSTANAIGTTAGYVAYVRGDRSCLPSNGTITATTLRTTGSIYMGTQSAIPVTANKLALIGNIYPSAIDFRNLTRSGGVDNLFYVWDPKLTGSYGLGAYQTFTLSGGNYIVTPGGGSYGASGSVNNTIQSGQAFFVHATGSAGTVQFTEPAKTSGSSVVFFGNSVGEQLVSNLFAVTGSGNQLADGTLTLFDAAHNNGVDANDALKLPNLGEGLSIRRNNQLLAVEQRKPVQVTDTLFFNLSGLKQQDYLFEFNPSNMNHPGLRARLLDAFQGTDTPVALDSVSHFSFTVDANPASADSARLMIVFNYGSPLPLSFINVAASEQNSQVNVTWKVANQLQIHHYEVEKSPDGNYFSKAGEVAAQISTTSHDFDYSWTDISPAKADNYYRIRSVGNNGEIRYSQVVSIKISKLTAAIRISPNPMINHRIGIQFSGADKGIYQIRLINAAGQVLYRHSVSHTGGSASQELALPASLPAGYYTIELIKPDANRFAQPAYLAD